MAVIDLEDLLAAAGRDLGSTVWTTVEHLQLTVFAAATGGDPFETDAPAYFVLALTNLLMPDLLEVGGATSGVNYGTGQVRFPKAVKAGDRVRGRAVLTDATEVAGGIQTTVELHVDIEGEDEPACVVESLSRWLR